MFASFLDDLVKIHHIYNTIGIVYNQQSESDEYVGYIEYLHHIGLLENTIEKYQLEEIQVERRLKGIRINTIIE